jgi:NADPH-dependent 2,4-dienoyl-CoA reductase/sulfur reductase-like enzyme
VTLVERAGQLMATLDEDMAAHVQDAAEGVGYRRPARRRSAGGHEHGRRVDGEELPADHVVMATGVRPATASRATRASSSARAARCASTITSAALGHDGVFAAGDCVESWHRVLERPMNVQLGTHANKQGRIAGANATGADLAFPGVIGTAASKICRYEVARTGSHRARGGRRRHRGARGDDQGPHRAGYYPGSGPIWVKLVVAPDGRLLGGQIVGTEGAAKRIDVLAACIWTGMAVDELELLDVSYARPTQASTTRSSSRAGGGEGVVARRRSRRSLRARADAAGRSARRASRRGAPRRCRPS